MAGWVKLHRSILDWEWYDDTNVFRLFIHLILTANYEDKKWRGKIIKKGQIATSIAKLAEATGLTPKMVRGAIQKLEKSNELVTEGASNYTLITICKYNKYQFQDNNEGKQRANEGQTKGEPLGKRRATTKELKKEEYINTPPYSPPVDRQENVPEDGGNSGGGGEDNFKSSGLVQREGHPPGIVRPVYNMPFEEFWAAWIQATAKSMNNSEGKDSGKEAAWLVWSKREKFRNLPGLPVLLDALSNHCESQQWTKQKGQFIPAAKKWLEEGKWADKLPAAQVGHGYSSSGAPQYNGMNINSVAQGITAENDAIARRLIEKRKRREQNGEPVAIGTS
ncbi:hypothetical protein [Maridesulfovibrio bastinii]|uniref:hypothetical protein n=1 Tax=Maridesulfovibrio bastinii TaxID=47157 RepID=UPI000413CB1B|nr:hypothetical protein [Maridesulfovibrio bastinii]